MGGSCGTGQQANIPTYVCAQTVEEEVRPRIQMKWSISREVEMKFRKVTSLVRLPVIRVRSVCTTEKYNTVRTLVYRITGCPAHSVAERKGDNYPRGELFYHTLLCHFYLVIRYSRVNFRISLSDDRHKRARETKRNNPLACQFISSRILGQLQFYT